MNGLATYDEREARHARQEFDRESDEFESTL